MVRLFDFDGTLVDSMPIWGGEMLNILKEEGICYPDDMVRILTPLGYRGGAEYFINEMGVKSTVDELVERMHAKMAKRYATEVELKATVKEYLEMLYASGDRLAVLTASPHPTVDLCLERCGVFALFERVWTCDDFGKVKSDKSIYSDAAHRLGVKESEIVFYDDNLCALSTAKAAGLKTVGVYDPSSDVNEEQIRSTVNLYVYKMGEAAGKI